MFKAKYLLKVDKPPFVDFHSSQINIMVAHELDCFLQLNAIFSEQQSPKLVKSNSGSRADQPNIYHLILHDGESGVSPPRDTTNQNEMQGK